MKQPSIFKQLYAVMGGLLLLLFVLASVLDYFNIVAQTNRSRDDELVNSSRAFWNSLRAGKEGDAEDEHDVQELARSYRDALPDAEFKSLRVLKGDKLIFLSGNAELSGAPVAGPEFSERHIDGHTWRTYAYYVRTQNIVIEVSENLFGRRQLVNALFFGFLESSVLLLPLLALLLFTALRYCLRGLTRMERTLALRGPQSLEKIDSEKLPKELQPLRDVINFLLEKLQATLAQERQLIDNAAHELRTPLATLKLHAQLAEDAASEAERAESMGDLRDTIERTEQLLDQLLALSRLAIEEAVKAPVRLYAVAEHCVQRYAALAAAKGINLRIDGECETECLTHAGLLELLLGVLLDNAVKYTPPHGDIRLRVAPGMIELDDSGPGIAPQERENVFQRFYRGRQGAQGNGLGLAIARQVGEVLGIRIVLDDASATGGLRVRLIFSLFA